MKIHLSELERRRLQKLLDQMLAAFSASAQDRRDLCTLEFERPGPEGALHGAAEVRSDSVAGTVLTWIDRGLAASDPRIADLQAWSINKEPAVIEWRAANAGNFAAYNKYLEAIEELRSAAAAIAARMSTPSETP